MEQRAEGNSNSAAPAGLRLPIVANLLLLLVSVAVVSIGVYLLSQQTTSAIRFESRFITAEWRLLAELKERTDRILEAKDREITFLRSRLLSLVRKGASDTERRSIISQLEQAYVERNEIMDLRINPPPVVLEQSPAAEGSTADQTPGPEVVDELIESSRFQVSDDSFQPEVLSPGENPALAWYRRVLGDLTALGPQTASRRLARAPGGVGGLSERDRTTLSDLVDRARDRQELRERLTTLDRELAQARSRMAQLREVVASLEEELVEARVAVAESEQRESRLLSELGQAEASAEEDREANRALRGEIASARDRRIEAEAAARRARLEAEQARSEAEQARTAAEEARMEVTTLSEALSETLDRAEELERRLAAVPGELEEAESDAREQGRETGETQALAWSRLLLDYLAGQQIDSPEAARQRLINLWEEEEKYRELIVQAQRLANAGIAEGRDDLPSQLLLGYLRSISGETAEVEILTDVTLSPGDSVQIRQRSDIPPGGLVAEATVLQRRGNSMQIRIEQDPQEPPKPNQLVYISGSPRRE